jgi:Putative beta-barrel porin-2, OmpL-like. bbp2
MYLSKCIFFSCLTFSALADEPIQLLKNEFSYHFPGTYQGFPIDVHQNSMINHILFDKSKDLSVFGWVNPSYNWSNAQNSNLPSGFNIVPNHMELNQASLVIQKSLDTTQKDSPGIGFKIINWWGIDYRFSTMQGIFSQQLLQENLLYGYDMPEAYMEFYLPHVGEGTLVTLGRYQSRGDIESLYAPDNYQISHSLMYMTSAFTQFGFNFNTILNENWSYLLGIHSGSDIAPWGASAVPTLMSFVRWLSSSQMDSIFLGINSINNGQYRNNHDNLQQFNGIYTHRFNECLFLQAEAYYEYQFNARLGGSSIFGPVEPYGGGKGEQPIIPGYSGSLGFLNYLEFAVNDRNLWSFRFDYLNDFQGQRTGYPTQYIGGTVGWSHLIADIWRIRPEIRYVSSIHLPAFDNGTKNHLLMGLIDFVVMI